MQQIKALLFIVFCLQLSACSYLGSLDENELAQAKKQRWSQERIEQWHNKQPWIVGANFLPSTAINQLEMWQAKTFDPETIDRELGWAADLGMNTVRVYLHDLAWQADAQGFKKRIDIFLSIADKHQIKPTFVFFDDCWNPTASIGTQPEPIQGIHNSGWLQSPEALVKDDPQQWLRLEQYVKDIVSHFAQDERILYWDVYNEPGNESRFGKSLPLLKKAFLWVRTINPSQPITAGVWDDSFLFDKLNAYQLAASDIITFHNYNGAENLAEKIAELKTHNRPLICTEWLARTNDSNVATHLPIFKSEKVGAINWGLVTGKSNTIYSWGSEEGSGEPKIWFHDLLRKNGQAFDESETALFKKLSN